MNEIQKAIKDGRKSFGSTAEFILDNNKLILKNTANGELHPFLYRGSHVNFITLGKEQILKVNELINA